MKKFLNVLCSFIEKTAVVYLVLLFLAVLTQIIMRNIFNKGSAFIEEFSRYCSVSAVFLMIPVIAAKKAHIIVDMFVNLLPEKRRKPFSVFSAALSGAFMLFLLYSISKVMEMNWNVRTPGMRMLNVVYYISITVGIAAACFVWFFEMFENLTAKGDK